MITLINPVRKRPNASDLFASPAGDHYLRLVLQEAAGTVYKVLNVTMTLTAAPNNSSVATAGVVVIATVKITVATATDAVTVATLPQAEPIR